MKKEKAQYKLDRGATKIASLSPGEIEKYKYLAGEDFGYKPGGVEKDKSVYSPLGEVFHKGLKEDEKEKGIEVKNKEQLLIRQ